MSNSAYALGLNSGANCDGITGASQSSFTNADYSSLASAINSSNYVNIAGDAAGSIPLQVKISSTERNGPPTTGSFGSVTVGNNGAFNVIRDFPSVSSVTSIDLDFRNRITEQPMFLTNVAFSAFDIDYVTNYANSFDDYVLFTGITANGNTIDGTYQAVNDSDIRAYTDTRENTPGQGLYMPGLGPTYFNRSVVIECAGDNLDTKCQGSIKFSEPVKSVKIRYSNANFRIYANPTNQQIFFRVDSYCYVPQYIFSGIVFDDNGGIPVGSASKDNADITSASSVYTNRPNYFNGKYDPTAPETGITGSTVRLINCANTSTVYSTQSVIRSDAPVGEYQISIPTTTLSGNTNLCLLETRTGTSYPIRTSSDRKTIAFAANTYNYPNNDFGRVIAENVALVLTKYQYINNCPATLNYTGISESTTPVTGFSTASIDKIDPGKCVAYKITATNRANTSINNFIMEDILQKNGVNNATVTSVLANPALATADYDNSSPAIGQNGIVKTRSLVLNSRTKRDFYFNTKYGATQSN